MYKTVIKYTVSLLHKSFTDKRTISCVRAFRRELFSSNVLFQSTVRSNPIVMKLESPEFKSIFTDEVLCLANLFKEYGYEIRIAGGAVRDLLMGNKPKDLDFATTATPDQMKEMFNTENIRMINTKGEKHGTITPRINDKENFEVTTLRIDVLTDGRHAEVEFTTDWKLDANRRDLTINSMFLGLDGTVYDYFYGFEDLQNRRIAFVGDPEKRIREDYLRILRYFRFYGRIAEAPDKHEPETLQCIKENSEGLSRISGERIWTELSKILEGNFAGELIKTMLDVGLSPYLSLPENCDINEFSKVWEMSKLNNLQLRGITLLSALFRSQEEFMVFHSRVKLSCFDRDLGLFVIENREDKPHVNPIKPYQLLVVNSKSKLSDITDFIIEVLKYKGNVKLMEEFKAWKLPRFPVTGVMIMEKGVPGGKPTGIVMKKLKELWAENDFTMSGEELVNLVPQVIDSLQLNFNERIPKKKKN